MNTWRAVLGQIKGELLRTSQGVGSYRVIPNHIEIDLPSDEFTHWQPVLASVAGELGEALQSWASQSEALWYAESGPAIDVRLQPVSTVRIHCRFGV